MKHIVKILLLTITSLSISMPCNAEETNTYDLERFFTYYYLHPDPNNLSVALEDFLKSDVLLEMNLDEHTESVTVYFFAIASKSEPGILENYKNLFEFGTHKQRLFMLKILRFCGNEDVKNFFISKLDAGRFVNESEQILDALEEGIPIEFNPLTEPLENAGDLDFLWTEFMATGNEEAVIKIINALVWDDSSIGSKLISKAAEWSLNSNCIFHKKVLEICKEELSKAESAYNKPLQRIIDELETLKILTEFANSQGLDSQRVTEIVNGVKAWSLGCSAVVVEKNHSRHDLLGMDKRTARNIEKSIISLRESSWKISSRKDLFDRMIGISVEGDRKKFERTCLSLMGLTEAERSAVLEMFTAKDVNTTQILFAEKLHKKVGDKSILAWDYGRLIFLCRWGYMCGYITEEEAWTIIIEIARMLQKQFDSWEDLGQNYIIGRQFGFYEEMQEEGYKFEDAFQRLVDMPSSPWNMYPWDMDLY